MNSALPSPHACPFCLQRGWLLAQLAPYLEKHLADPSNGRVFDLLALSSEDLARVVAPDQAGLLIGELEAKPERAMTAALDGSGCWAVCHHDPLYPSGLCHGDQAPWALFGRGDASLLVELSEPAAAVAVVGARRATSYGREVAHTLGRDLAAAGLTVVSGMAFGIDACAHRGALEAGRTIAVLGCGADVAYPASHRSLWRRIQESGLVLSELPPGTGAWRWSFPARNRIVAGLAGITVVVEAAKRSGSLITAEIAADLGREVGAVPGPVSLRTSVGPNDLLADGASLIRNAGDVLSFPLRSEPVVSVPQPPDPLRLSHEAQAIIGEERVPAEVLSELVSTYGPEEEGRGDEH
jgi:DNA processing protein